jgi:hypothetical protein
LFGIVVSVVLLPLRRFGRTAFGGGHFPASLRQTGGLQGGHRAGRSDLAGPLSFPADMTDAELRER